MSAKKNKSKSKKASEGESSVSLKEGSDDPANLQTSGHEGGNCKRFNNSFAVIDFIDKGKELVHDPYNQLITSLSSRKMFGTRAV